MPLLWTEQNISVVSSGTLHGTMTFPINADPMPVALIISGSGPTDRDGNQPKMINDSLKLLAHNLAEQGIGSLRVDKRGVAESKNAGPREEDLRFGTYVADALTWLDRLRADPRVARIVIIGHSEGALIATIASQQTHVAGLVLMAGAGEPAGDVIKRQFATLGAPPVLQENLAGVLSALQNGQTPDNIPPPLAHFFRPSVCPYLSSWLPLDPAAELAKTTNRPRHQGSAGRPQRCKPPSRPTP